MNAVRPGESTTQAFPGDQVLPDASAPAGAGAATALSAAEPITAPHRRHLMRLQWIVAVAIIGLALLVVVRLWMIDGFMRRVSIDGPSMAPAFYGAHYLMTCGDCGFGFRCNAADLPASGLVVCPNCGFGKNKPSAANLHGDERVLIDQWPLLWRTARLGEIVAAEDPQPADDLVGPVIKRVAALPGEQLEIQEGDLFADGQRVRKTIRQCREVRLLVHDNDYEPRQTPDLPLRWQPAAANSSWKEDGGSFRIGLPAGGDGVKMAAGLDEFDWIQYCHWPCMQSLVPRTRIVPILDNDSFNQNVSRELNPVRDIMLTCRLEATGSGRLALAATDGSDRFEVIVEPAAKRVLLVRSGTTLAERTLPADFFRRGALIEFGLCDRQVLLAIGGRTIIVSPYDDASSSRPRVLHPLAIGASNLAVEVSHVKVWRDVYYLEPQGTARPWKADRLAADEFALLGDNPPVSMDSRHWPGSGGVRRAQIFGRVVRPFWAADRQSHESLAAQD